MNLSEKMKEITFLSTRQIIDMTDHSGIGIVGFKEDENDIYSSIVGSPPSESGIVGAQVMISSKGCLLRLDDGEKTILISAPKDGDKETFAETYPSSLEEGEFFQNTLVQDFRHITYEHIVALRQVLDTIDVICSKDN